MVYTQQSPSPIHQPSTDIAALLMSAYHVLYQSGNWPSLHATTTNMIWDLEYGFAMVTSQGHVTDHLTTGTIVLSRYMHISKINTTLSLKDDAAWCLVWCGIIIYS